MPKVHTRRISHRRSKPTRRNNRKQRAQRKQRGGDLTANLVTKRDDVLGFVDAIQQEGQVSIHPNFPRKNAENKYVLIFKDIYLEDDAAPQKLLVIKMEKQGAEFVNVTAESLQDGVPQIFMDEYPIQLDVLDADSIAFSAALGAAFPEAGLAY